MAVAVGHPVLTNGPCPSDCLYESDGEARRNDPCARCGSTRRHHTVGHPHGSSPVTKKIVGYCQGFIPIQDLTDAQVQVQTDELQSILLDMNRKLNTERRGAA